MRKRPVEIIPRAEEKASLFYQMPRIFACCVEIRNANLEIRNKHEIRRKKTQDQNSPVSVIRILDFEFASDFEIRISSFGSGFAAQ
jgi:hypothetical protein